MLRICFRGFPWSDPSFDVSTSIDSQDRLIDKRISKIIDKQDNNNTNIEKKWEEKNYPSTPKVESLLNEEKKDKVLPKEQKWWVSSMNLNIWEKRCMKESREFSRLMRDNRDSFQDAREFDSSVTEPNDAPNTR